MFADCYLRLGKAPFASAAPLTVSLLSSLYALPARGEAPLRPVLEALGEGHPWSESLTIAPEQSAAAVGAMLRHVMMAAPGLDPARVDVSVLVPGSRARAHLGALVDLWRAHPETMPADLQVLGDLLACGAGDALQPMAILHRRDDPRHSPLERAVLDHLESHHGATGPEDTDYQRLIAAPLAPAAPDACLLGHVQRHLLDPAGGRAAADDSLAILSVRDSMAEAEAAAAIIQRWLAQDGVAPGDIGVILPHGADYALALGEVFARAGLLASNMPGVAARRNIGAEAVLHFLQCRRRPAPAMALASLYCSPALCWGGDVGNALARAAMEGDFEPQAARALTGRAGALFGLIRSAPPANNGQLKEHLRRFRSLLSEDEAMAEDVLEAKGHLARLTAALAAAPDKGEPDWEKLIPLAAAYQAIAAQRGPRYLGAIDVLHAHEAPTRRYRKLLVLGFNDGAYPAPPSGNPFFLDSEVAQIAQATGLELPSQASQLDAAQALFARQIGAAGEQAILLLSERDRGGAGLAPSSSLPLVARLVDGADDPEKLVHPLARGEGTIWDRLIDWRARPEFKSAKTPEIPVHYHFDTNLLALRKKEDGTARAQSPSRLEKLLVSPLAWLLGELGATHVAWAPEGLDVMLRGSLAHEVFEHLFAPGRDHPDDDAIAARVPELLAERIRAIAPFLQSAAWAVERMALESEIIAAARHWSMVLGALGAEIVGNEFWLSGEVLGHPVHGMADCLLRLPDGQPVVVDYKKSSSGTRRQRLTKGYDLQVDLYRRMNVRVDEKSSEGVARIAQVLTEWGRLPAVAYHTLNDGNVLMNGADGVNSEHVEAIGGDIAQHALLLLKARFEALRSGRIDTNTTADEAYFRKEAALGTYALADSPLVAAFMREDEAPSVELTEASHD
ncbi:PD-(D/E)XK nuclease family protein [Novosphingobium humi]|uniref:PD-(D/E)XK nuclease family protein n=1 Tax=Novosphingobium humi TaxID=2282397 RepID=A0ABY7U467_9SPHN|nr:PD-(D/E)XK nuclease family protein [Novosphingobium humi]WCT80263.1 PD-(D/E)XK nuclease family protein [Novosphingobium humi]